MNCQYFNPSEYLEYFSNPLWYMDLHPTIQELYVDYLKLPKEEQEKVRPMRMEFTMLVGELLDKGSIALAEKSIYDFDEERESIDTIVIHHTGSTSSRATNPYQYINAVDMLQVYVPQFRNEEREYYKTPLWSGHFYNGKMTFVPYHYLIHTDGKIENILKDNEIGWHAGNWEINKRSIAVTFIADLEESEPTPDAIKSAREVIGRYRLKIKNESDKELELLGHREINEKTHCPGNLFLGENGWKTKLIN